MDSAGLIPCGVTRPVAVLAHPDDEALWCAGLIADTRALGWTIIACSIPVRDPFRAYQFFKSCQTLGAKPRLIPFPESDPLKLDDLDLSEFDFVLTHGDKGEYGHRHHIQIHNHISERHGEMARYIGYGGKHRFVVPVDGEARDAKMAALKCYNAGDPPQWTKLLKNYGGRYDLWNERYW